LALISGLLAAGARVKNAGLALSPMAYFAQFALDTQSVAMVTASHNENGWTGVKMGAARPLTFGPDEMSALKEIVLGGDVDLAGGGAYEFFQDFRKAHLDDLTAGKDNLSKAQGCRRLRQRYCRRLRAGGSGAHRLRGDPARYRTRSHFPALQSEPGRFGDAARHP
jgi:phosphomannomutase